MQVQTLFSKLVLMRLTIGAEPGGREGAHAPPQPPKIFLTYSKKISKCHFCPPTTAKFGAIETQSPNFWVKLQL